MNGEVAGTFIYNGVPQNGATAKLWQITGFAAYADSTDEVENNPMAATDIELTVNDDSNFAVGDIIKIDSELCRVRAIDTNLLYVIRGYRGTTPASHTQNTQIDKETVTEPQQDDSEPDGGYQQGGNVTTAVTYGGDGAYRWTAVPEGEYYVSVYYDSHRSFLYHSVENDDVSLEKVLTVAGDIVNYDGTAITKLGIGSNGEALIVSAGALAWGEPAGVAITNGNYSGDDSVNRAITHGLGATPKLVVGVESVGNQYRYHIFGGSAEIYYDVSSSAGALAVTAPDATYFYVGNATSYVQSANASGDTIYWAAFA